MPTPIRVTDRLYYIDVFHKSNLDILKQAVDANWDGWMIYDGGEGVGKTTSAAADAYYLGYNPKSNKSNFNIDSIVWTSEQFIAAVNRASVGDVILWDEFVLGGLSTEAMTEMQNTLIKFSTTIRKKRLYILLLIPYIFMLRKYFALGRPRALIHVITPDGIARGKFKFYDKEQLRILYQKGKNDWSYPTEYAFIGDYYIKGLSELGIDQEEYERRKDKAISMITQTKESKNDIKVEKYRSMCVLFIKYLNIDMEMTYKDIIKKLSLPVNVKAIQNMVEQNAKRIESSVDDENEEDN